MARRKSNTGKGQPKRRSWWKSPLRFVALSPVRYWYLTLPVIIVLLLYWQRGTLVWLGTGIADLTMELFGWGLALIISAIVTLVVMAWLRKLLLLVHRWYQLLGGIAVILAAWGILAVFNLGGSFGLGIVGIQASDFLSTLMAILRIAGLILVGLILVAPGASFSVVRKSVLWLVKPRQRQPAVARSAPQRSPAPPPVTVTAKPAEPEPPVVEPAIEPATAPVAATPPPTRKGLKQVAEEVWKKYGESPTLVTVDGWRLPPIDILDMLPEVQFSHADNQQRAKIIEEALGSYGVEAKVVQINAGPTVTQFGLEPGWDRRTREVRERDKDGNVTVRLEEVSKTRVKVDRINSLSNDLALALAAPSIRIEAPVPGKPMVGVEVPNTVSSMVSLRGVIETSGFQKLEAKSKLGLALGKGAGGEAVVGDLSRMPHLLIAGATGSGKTVCLNATICCLLLYNTPNDVRFVMIDPKRVELSMFNSIPHLAAPVIVDTNKALGALRWLAEEMNRRYQLLATAAARNIDGYNKNRQGDEKMPYLVLVIDELADLMMAVGDEVEQILCRLAQLSRAVGIHLVVATQRPSVDVVTGLIKANFPTRISFAVTSQVDSRTILDGGGAEKLLGRGDMLYMPTDAAKPKRLQGCFVSDAEAERLVYFWGSQHKDEPPPPMISDLVTAQATVRQGGPPVDPLMKDARQLAEEHEHISTSFLQRRLRIGYPRAARIMEQLQEEMAEDEREAEEEEEE